MTSKGWRSAHRTAVDDHLATVRLAIAGEDLEQRLLALAFEGGEAEHLAGRHSEADVVELASGADAPGFEHRALADRRGGRPLTRFVAHAGGGFAEHGLDDRRLATLAGNERGDITAVTQHGAHVAVLAHLGESVGDEQHGAVALAPRRITANTRSDRSGGRAAVISSRRSSCGSNVRARARSSMRRNGRGTSRTCSPRSSPSRSISASWRPHGAEVGAGEAEVLGDGEIGGHRRVLEHRGEAAAAGIAGTVQGRRLAVDADRPGIGAQHAGEDLDERRLAGAVGAEQGVDLAGRDGEVDGAQGDDRPERLGDAAVCSSGVVMALCSCQPGDPM